jgi:hypothetical protein
VLYLTKNGLAHILGDFFWSGSGSGQADLAVGTGILTSADPLQKATITPPLLTMPKMPMDTLGRFYEFVSDVIYKINFRRLNCLSMKFNFMASLVRMSENLK